MSKRFPEDYPTWSKVLLLIVAAPLWIPVVLIVAPGFMLSYLMTVATAIGYSIYWMNMHDSSVGPHFEFWVLTVIFLFWLPPCAWIHRKREWFS